jgi:hypothetical protein
MCGFCCSLCWGICCDDDDVQTGGTELGGVGASSNTAATAAQLNADTQANMAQQQAAAQMSYQYTNMMTGTTEVGQYRQTQSVV